MGRKDQLDHAASVRDSLLCPGCEYSLRGLGGDVVTCPECGERVDVASMVTRQWRKPWWEAPGYSMLCLPCSIGIVGTFIALAIVLPLFEQAPFITSLTLLGVTLTWVITMAFANRLLPDGRGVLGALIAHVILVGYLAATALFITFIVRAFQFSTSWPETVLHLMLLAIPIGLFILGRRGEQMLAGWLIREHLRKTAAPPTLRP